MIKVHCRTNIDAYRMEQWPEEFVVAPQIGNFVESDNYHVLQIKEITHKMSHSWRSTQEREPILEVYLGKIC